MIFIYMFVVSILVVGLVEWLKNFLPSKIKENKITMSLFMAVVSVLVGGTFVFVPGIILNTNIITKVLFIGGVIALTQTCYTLLFKTFKTIKNYLSEKIKKLK